jgi:hypothetical protein
MDDPFMLGVMLIFFPPITSFARTPRLARPEALTPFAIHRISHYIIPNHPHMRRCRMDIAYLAGISLFFALAVGLAAGCAKLGGTS